jgi:hypothetical protein
MNQFSIAVASLIVAGAAHSAQLYNNGPVVGANGVSARQPGALTYGAGAQAQGNNAVADDFTIGADSWRVSDFSFYAYQTNAANFSITFASWAIIAGANVNTGTVVASGVTAGANDGYVGYREEPSRRIYRINADIDDVTLKAGHYWLAWALEGTAASGPWVPPVADGRAGNAQQSVAGSAFSLLTDSGNGQTMELPFAVNGIVISAVPEAPGYAMLLAGLGLLGIARRRR